MSRTRRKRCTQAGRSEPEAHDGAGWVVRDSVREPVSAIRLRRGIVVVWWANRECPVPCYGNAHPARNAVNDLEITAYVQ